LIEWWLSESFRGLVKNGHLKLVALHRTCFMSSMFIRHLKPRCLFMEGAKASERNRKGVFQVSFLGLKQFTVILKLVFPFRARAVDILHVFLYNFLNQDL